jgi:hypothetical protein
VTAVFFWKNFLHNLRDLKLQQCLCLVDRSEDWVIAREDYAAAVLAMNEEIWREDEWSDD